MRKEQFKVGDIVVCKKERGNEYEIISVTENKEFYYNIKEIKKGYIYKSIIEYELELKGEEESWKPLFKGDDTVGMNLFD
tara:strand:- start:1753 stop:1992 length:240 start_codon:yes stop_codon:yes gene_type:complete